MSPERSLPPRFSADLAHRDAPACSLAGPDVCQGATPFQHQTRQVRQVGEHSAHPASQARCSTKIMGTIPLQPPVVPKERQTSSQAEVHGKQ